MDGEPSEIHSLVTLLCIYTLQDELTHISLQQLSRVYFITSSHNEVSFSKTHIDKRKRIKTKDRIEKEKKETGQDGRKGREGEGREEEKGKIIKQADWGKGGKEGKKKQRREEGNLKE